MLLLIIGSVAATAFLFIIHFFGLRLRQKLEFSHIQFLAALNAQTRSVRKINNLLLLLLRIVFVLSALACFWFFLTENNQADASTAAARQVVLDKSWSMQSKGKEGDLTKMAMAVKDAQSLAPEQDAATIPSANSNSKVKAAESSFLGLEATLQQLQAEANGEQTFFLSDFQRRDFTATVLDELSQMKNLSLVPYPAGGPNFFIDSVWLDQPIVTPNNSITLWARVAGSLQEENKQVSVQVKEDNALIGTTQVLLEPGQKRLVNFKLNLERGEPKKLVLEVEDPVNPFDNAFYALIPKPSVVPVKVSPTLEKNHPVLQAYKGESAFDFNAQSSETRGLWILDSGTALSDATAQQVKEWLQQGKSVLVLPGKENQQALIRFLNSIGLTGIRQAALEEGEKVLKDPDMSDAFFKGIFEKEVRNLKMPGAAPVLTWQSSYHTILKFKDNSPFLSTFKVGPGEVHLFAAPIQKSEAFAGHPLFVPVLYQLALQSIPPVTLAHQPVAGQLTVELPQVQESPEPYRLRGNNQTFVPQQKLAQNTLQLALPEEMGQAGFYEVMKGDKTVGQLAINIPRTQSYLESFTAEELQEQLANRESTVQVVEPDSRVPLQKQLQNETSANSLWKYCLILCLLCLIAEAVILSAKKRGSLI